MAFHFNIFSRAKRKTQKKSKGIYTHTGTKEIPTKFAHFPCTSDSDVLLDAAQPAFRLQLYSEATAF